MTILIGAYFDFDTTQMVFITEQYCTMTGFRERFESRYTPKTGIKTHSLGPS